MGRSAPSKTAAPSLSLESQPVSLLWAHQLRRENAALLDRMNGLAESVEEVWLGLEKAQSLANGAVQENTAMKANQKDSRLQDEGVKARLSATEEDLRSLRGDCRVMQVTVGDLETQVMSVKMGCMEGLSKVQETIGNSAKRTYADGIDERITSLERQLAALVTKDKETVLVRDSMEGLGRLMKEGAHGAHGKPFDTRTERDRGTRAVEALGDLVEDEYHNEIADVSEQILTMQQYRMLPTHHETSSSGGDIDLDENVATISYAGHLPHLKASNQIHLPPDSLVMLPEPTKPALDQSSDLTDLRQGLQSWQKYVFLGQAYVDKVPKRREGAVVEAFVRGISDDGDRLECERWLDDNEWTWEVVKAFKAEQVAKTTGLRPGNLTGKAAQSKKTGTRRRAEATQVPPVLLRSFQSPTVPSTRPMTSGARADVQEMAGQAHADRFVPRPAKTGKGPQVKIIAEKLHVGPRRSQRIAQKHSENQIEHHQEVHQQKAPVKEFGNQKLSHKDSGVQISRIEERQPQFASERPRNQPELGLQKSQMPKMTLGKRLRKAEEGLSPSHQGPKRTRVNQRTTKVQKQVARISKLTTEELGFVVTPSGQDPEQYRDVEEPYELPPMPALARSVSRKPDALIAAAPSMSKVIFGPGRKRKRDYKGHLVRVVESAAERHAQQDAIPLETPNELERDDSRSTVEAHVIGRAKFTKTIKRSKKAISSISTPGDSIVRGFSAARLKNPAAALTEKPGEPVLAESVETNDQEELSQVEEAVVERRTLRNPVPKLVPMLTDENSGQLGKRRQQRKIVADLTTTTAMSANPRAMETQSLDGTRGPIAGYTSGSTRLPPEIPILASSSSGEN